MNTSSWKKKAPSWRGRRSGGGESVCVHLTIIFLEGLRLCVCYHLSHGHSVMGSNRNLRWLSALQQHSFPSPLSSSPLSLSSRYSRSNGFLGYEPTGHSKYFGQTFKVIVQYLCANVWRGETAQPAAAVYADSWHLFVLFAVKTLWYLLYASISSSMGLMNEPFYYAVEECWPTHLCGIILKQTQRVALE